MSGKKSNTPRKPISTDAQLDKLKPGASAYDVKIANVPGLTVRVSKSGIKSFRWDRGSKYKDPRIMTYGHHSMESFTIKAARKLHEDAKQQHRDGKLKLNISKKPKQEINREHKHGSFVLESMKGTNVLDNPPKTISQLAEWFYANRIVPHRKRPDMVRQALRHDVLPFIGEMRSSTVTTIDVMQVVQKVVDRGATVHAGRVLSTVKQMFRYGVMLDVMKYNVAQPIDRMSLGIEDNQRDRKLSSSEIKNFWQLLGEAPRVSAPSKVALQLLILLGLRSGELRQAEWKHVDLDVGLLIIPVANQKLSPRQAKKAKDFTVPLDSFAIDLFKQLQGMDTTWVFPGASENMPFSNNVMSRLVARLIKDEIEPFTPHDLRRTVRSGLSKLKISPHVSERCLNHSLGKIVDTYDTHDYLDERREALEKWSQQVQVILGKHNNVVSMEDVA